MVNYIPLETLYEKAGVHNPNDDQGVFGQELAYDDEVRTNVTMAQNNLVKTLQDIAAGPHLYVGRGVASLVAEYACGLMRAYSGGGYLSITDAYMAATQDVDAMEKYFKRMQEKEPGGNQFHR